MLRRLVSRFTRSRRLRDQFRAECIADQQCIDQLPAKLERLYSALVKQ